MSTQVVEALSRHTAGISRRGSLMSLGVAGIAALASSVSGEAKKKSGKKNKKRKNKNPQPVDRCPAQVEPCADFLDALCGGRPECLDHSGCCAFLETCDVNTFLTCLVNQA